MIYDYLQPYFEGEIAVASRSLLEILLGYSHLKMFP